MLTIISIYYKIKVDRMSNIYTLYLKSERFLSLNMMNIETY